MNIAIVDDDQHETDNLSSVIKEYAALGKLLISIDEYHSAEEFLKVYTPYAYTAIFMDIYMPGTNGIEAAKEILKHDHRAIVIFLTSSDEHVMDAFSLHAYDYIAKPAVRERIFKVMDDVMLRQSKDLNEPSLTISCKKSDISFRYSDIVCIRTSGHGLLEVIDIDNNQYETRMNLSEVAEFLSDDHRFLLILRGILVNMQHIKQLSDGICLMKTGLKLPVNVKNSKKLETIWRNFMFDSIRNEGRERRNHR